MISNNSWQNYIIISINYYLLGRNLVSINSPFRRMGFSWNNKIIKITIKKIKGFGSQLLLLLLGLAISNWCRDRELWSFPATHTPKWCEILLLFSDGCCWPFMGRRNGGVYGVSFDFFFWVLLIFASGFFVSCLISGHCEASSRHEYGLCHVIDERKKEKCVLTQKERRRRNAYERIKTIKQYNLSIYTSNRGSSRIK